jgi:hypothetical protein
MLRKCFFAQRRYPAARAPCTPPGSVHPIRHAWISGAYPGNARGDLLAERANNTTAVPRASNRLSRRRTRRLDEHDAQPGESFVVTSVLLSENNIRFDPFADIPIRRVLSESDPADVDRVEVEPEQVAVPVEPLVLGVVRHPGAGCGPVASTGAACDPMVGCGRHRSPPAANPRCPVPLRSCLTET